MQVVPYEWCSVAGIGPKLWNSMSRVRPKRFVFGGRCPMELQYRNLISSTSFRDSSAVRILEVGPRDGLQNIKQVVPTAIKSELLRRLYSAGLNAIEATSFVSPKWIPQLADGPEVMRQALRLTEERPMRFPVLVPNMKGFERAVKNGAREVVVFASATEGFSRRNLNCTIEESLLKAKEVAEQARKLEIAVRGVVSCIFACPYDGPTEPQKALHVVKRFLDMGCYEVGLGDTLGVGTPTDVQNLLHILLAEIPADKLAGHFHDTYGQAVANVIQAYQMGLRAFDSSIAGLGGCPYAKGAKGNVATEDLAYAFEKSGIHTGIDLEKLVSVGDWISRQLGQPNGSRAGSALVAKRDKTTEIASGPAPSSLKRKWERLEDAGEYAVSRSGNVVKVTLTRPRNGNALTNSMVDGLTQLFTNISRDASVFHLILAAEGKFFCTGMDLSPSGSSNSPEESVKAEYYSKVVNLFSAVDNAPQTTIAMVDGPCFGGGVGLTFACDIRLVSTQSRFTMSEIKLGLSPAIISKYMVREWGVSFSREAILSGREVNPIELERIGAVHGLADTTNALHEMMESYLERLTSCAPRSASACKELVQLGWRDPGGHRQNDKIEQTFKEMMVDGSEGAFGLEQFKNKNRVIDWNLFWTGKCSPIFSKQE